MPIDNSPFVASLAEERAKRCIKKLVREKYAGYRLQFTRATHRLVELPDGWRFLFDASRGARRVSQGRVYIFVDRAGIATVEYDAISATPETLNAVKTKPKKVAYQIGEAEACAAVLDLYKDSDVRIESAERVYYVDKGLLPAWRIGLMTGIERRAVYVGTKWRKAFIVGDKSKMKGIDLSWTLGAASFVERRNSKLEIRLTRVKNRRLFAEWTIWSAISHAIDRLSSLGYRTIGDLRNTYIEYGTPTKEIGNAPSTDTQIVTNGPAANDPERLPKISFVENTEERRCLWAEDITIVLHEIWHAICCLYSPPMPHHLLGEGDIDLSAIEEGMADYFAATLLFDGKNPVEIGSQTMARMKSLLEKHKASLSHDDFTERQESIATAFNGNTLPRIVESTAFRAMGVIEEGNKYNVAQQWSHLLWAFREAVGAEVADPIIFSAHLRPISISSEPRSRRHAFCESLEQTALRMNVNFDWAKLMRNHRIGQIL